MDSTELEAKRAKQRAYIREWRELNRDAIRAKDRARQAQRRRAAGMDMYSMSKHGLADPVDQEQWNPEPGWFWDLVPVLWCVDLAQVQAVVRGAGAKRKKGGRPPGNTACALIR